MGDRPALGGGGAAPVGLGPVGDQRVQLGALGGEVGEQRRPRPACPNPGTPVQKNQACLLVSGSREPTAPAAPRGSAGVGRGRAQQQAVGDDQQARRRRQRGVDEPEAHDLGHDDRVELGGVEPHVLARVVRAGERQRQRRPAGCRPRGARSRRPPRGRRDRSPRRPAAAARARSSRRPTTATTSATVAPARRVRRGHADVAARPRSAAGRTSLRRARIRVTSLV